MATPTLCAAGYGGPSGHTAAPGTVPFGPYSGPMAYVYFLIKDLDTAFVSYSLDGGTHWNTTLRAADAYAGVAGAYLVILDLPSSFLNGGSTIHLGQPVPYPGTPVFAEFTFNLMPSYTPFVQTDADPLFEVNANGCWYIMPGTGTELVIVQRISLIATYDSATAIIDAQVLGEGMEVTSQVLFGPHIIGAGFPPLMFDAMWPTSLVLAGHSPRCSVAIDAGGALWCAHQSGTDVLVKRIPSDLASAELRYTLAGVYNPCLRVDNRNVLWLMYTTGITGSSSVTRSFDGGRNWA